MSWEALWFIPITFSLYAAYKYGRLDGQKKELDLASRRHLVDLERKRYAAAAEDFAWEQEPEEIERIAVEIGGEYLRTDWTVR